MELKFAETVIPQNIAVGIKGQLGLDATVEEAVFFTEVVVAAASDFLRTVKNKERPVALQFEDLKGNMIAAAVVEYHENPNKKDEKDQDNMQDNWNYYWTYDKDDILDAMLYSLSSDGVQAIIAKRAASMHRMILNSPSSTFTMTGITVQAISDYLQQNAKADDKLTITHEGFFVAEAEVKGEKIEKAFIPDGAMKVLIKFDPDTENVAA